MEQYIYTCVYIKYMYIYGRIYIGIHVSGMWHATHLLYPTSVMRLCISPSRTLSMWLAPNLSYNLACAAEHGFNDSYPLKGNYLLIPRLSYPHSFLTCREVTVGHRKQMAAFKYSISAHWSWNVYRTHILGIDYLQVSVKYMDMCQAPHNSHTATSDAVHLDGRIHVQEHTLQ